MNPSHLEIPPVIRLIAHIRSGPAFKALAVVSLMLIAVNGLSDLLSKINQKGETSRQR
jgi:hypothetical protein